MGKVIASITTSVDGYGLGPDDGPEYGLGRGGERLHHWVMGGPWTYEGGPDFAMHGPDQEFYDELVSTVASGVVGRGMYDAAGAWGGTNPFPGTLFVLTHRTADQPPAEGGFRFVADLDTALVQAAEAAGDGDVALGGGADGGVDADDGHDHARFEQPAGQGRDDGPGAQQRGRRIQELVRHQLADGHLLRLGHPVRADAFKARPGLGARQPAF